MLYRKLGNTGKKLSAIGMGTNRFAVTDLKDENGLDRAADILYKAIEYGVNYIDCGHTYAMGQAEKIVKLALEKIRKSQLVCYTSTKVMYAEDHTSDAARRRLEKSLEVMGINKVTFGFCWKVSSYNEFEKIVKHGGIYDGLYKAKEEGLIEHLCISSHASPDETIKILQTGLFEACMISCNVLNVNNYEKLLEFAASNGIGIFTMNSLGGGVITKQEEINHLLFKKDDSKLTIVQKALCSLYSNKAITCMLSSVEDLAELEENTSLFTPENVKYIEKQKLVKNLKLPRYCTKCRYCRECPAEIPIADMMYAYSNRLFTELMYGYGSRDKLKVVGGGKSEKEITEQIFNARFCDYVAIPKTDKNPCLKCGRCEKICTQNLPIIDRVSEMYERAEKVHYSHEQRKKRLDKRLNWKGYKKVGFFPAGNYTLYVLEAYLEYFGSFPFEIFVFDNNSSLWGKNLCESIMVYSPDRIKDLEIDYILVSNYKFGEIIYQELLKNHDIVNKHILVEKLHEEEDIAWY